MRSSSGSRRASVTNLALLKAYLAPLGTEWSSEDGQLRLGFSPIAGHSDVVDAAAQAAGGEATIFRRRRACRNDRS